MRSRTLSRQRAPPRSPSPPHSLIGTSTPTRTATTPRPRRTCRPRLRPRSSDTAGRCSRHRYSGCRVRSRTGLPTTPCGTMPEYCRRCGPARRSSRATRRGPPRRCRPRTWRPTTARCARHISAATRRQPHCSTTQCLRRILMRTHRGCPRPRRCSPRMRAAPKLVAGSARLTRSTSHPSGSGRPLATPPSRASPLGRAARACTGSSPWHRPPSTWATCPRPPTSSARRRSRSACGAWAAQTSSSRTSTSGQRLSVSRCERPTIGAMFEFDVCWTTWASPIGSR
mmetsp:Transcript_58523/g.164089  ORF Transcript_58523/g.164089 Transcript_58523/m.164089 type:complete len:284 (-) Transcript_58523:432-1283(-)